MPLADRVVGAGRRSFRQHLLDLKHFDAEVAPILRDAAREADRIIRIGLANDVRQAQMKLTLAALVENHDALFKGVTRSLASSIRGTTATASEGMFAIDTILADTVGSSALRESFLFAARHSVVNLQSRLLNNIKLSPRVYKTQALSKRWVERAVNRGILMNKSAAEIAADVRRLILPTTPGGVSFAAKRLARTEINNAFHTTTVRQARAQPWVEGMQWNLSGSHPRTDPCDEYAQDDPDGLGEGVYKPNNVPNKPHPQCLCFVTVVVMDEKEFIDKLVAGKFDRFLAT